MTKEQIKKEYGHCKLFATPKDIQGVVDRTIDRMETNGDRASVSLLVGFICNWYAEKAAEDFGE